MSRPKTYRKALNCKIDGNIWDTLDDFCNDSGVSKTIAIEQALNQYLQMKIQEKKMLEEIKKKNKK